MVYFLMSLLIAFWGTYISLKLLKPIAVKVLLLDKPNDRKHHKGAVPLVGGVAIYIGFFLAMLVVGCSNLGLSNCFIIATGVILLAGILDDQFDLSVRAKMLLQLVAASIMMFDADLQLRCLGNLFGFGDVYLGWFSMFFTYCAILGAINAFNMADGIDGLIGGVAMNTMLFLTLFFSHAGWFYETWICIILIAALLPFMLFNLTRSDHPKLKKIFMGDAGSMFIGFTIVWLLTVGTQGDEPAFRPVTALWVTAIPLMDMVNVMICRRQKGSSPFQAGRDHLHHIFLNAGFSSRQSLLMIIVLCFFISAFGVMLEKTAVPEVVSFGLFLVLFGVYFGTVKHMQRSMKFIKKIRTVVEFNEQYFDYKNSKKEQEI